MTPPARTTFLEFQARNRRATWRLGAVCALVVGGTAFVSTLGFAAGVMLVLFALVFAPAALAALLGLATLLHPAAAPLREPLFAAARFLLGGVDLITRLLPSAPRAAVVGAAVVAVAGWVAVRSVWLAAGVGEALLAMGARPPKPGDLEEHQLANLAEEMAIAAGIAAPRVWLIDGEAANAAAVGYGPADAHVVLGRRLLDEFDREETQGILAHLVGSIGNGDLRGAAQIHSLLYVIDLLVVLVLAPFARFPRRVARRWLAFPLTAPFRGREGRAAEARALARLLAEHRRMLPDPEKSGPAAAAYFGPIGRILVTVCPPFIALVLGTHVSIMFVLLLASVPVALLWRTRRYLADATAVELTRNPTALHRALAHLARCAAPIPGGEGLSHLYIVGSDPGATGGPPDRPRAARRRTFPEREGLLMGMHPSLRRRLARLVRMGAVVPRGD